MSASAWRSPRPAVPLWTHLSLLTECRARVEQAIASLGRQVPSDPRRDMRLYLALGHALLHTRASGGPEMNAALTKALELAEIIDDTRYRLGAILGLYAPSPQHGRVSRGPRSRREVSHRRSRDGRSFRCADRQPTHRAGAAHSGRPAGGATTPRAVGWLALRDGSAVAHHLLSVRPASRTRLLLRARSVVAGMWRSGKAAHRESRRLCPHEGSPALVSYTLLIAACPIALYVGDLTTADHHVRLAFDLAARHALEIWNVWAQCFEGILLIKRGDNRAGSQLLQSASRDYRSPPFITTESACLLSWLRVSAVPGRLPRG